MAWTSSAESGKVALYGIYFATDSAEIQAESSETLGEIAVDLGVSAERVRQLQNAAIKRLKTPALRRRLDDSTVL